MMTFEQWLRAILESIKEFGDLDFQKRVWTGKDPIPGVIATHDESIIYFLHERDVDGFIEECEKAGRFKNILPELKTFVSRIREHVRDNDDEQVEAILKSREWLELVDSAKRISAALEAPE